MVGVDALKAQVVAEVDRRADLLLDASHRIHAHPELGFEEHHAHDLLTARARADAGLDTERERLRRADGVPGRGRLGDGPTVAVLCEYDALPGDRPRLRPQRHRHGRPRRRPGRGRASPTTPAAACVVLGTPGRGGRRRQDRAWPGGAPSTGIDAALMVHPADADLLAMDAIAIQQLEVALPRARPPTPPPSPWEGRNALDAAVLGYIERGRAAPAHPPRPSGSTASSPRAATSRTSCPTHAAALSGTCARRHARIARSRSRRGSWPASRPAPPPPGARWTTSGTTTRTPTCSTTTAMVRRLRRQRRPHRPHRGRARRTSTRWSGSTDMGNVSYLVPVDPPDDPGGAAAACRSTPRSSPRYAGGAEGDRAVLDGAKALAMTVVDLWADADRAWRAAREPSSRHGPGAETAARLTGPRRSRDRGGRVPYARLP